MHFVFVAYMESHCWAKASLFFSKPPCLVLSLTMLALQTLPYRYITFAVVYHDGDNLRQVFEWVSIFGRISWWSWWRDIYNSIENLFLTLLYPPSTFEYFLTVTLLEQLLTQLYLNVYYTAYNRKAIPSEFSTLL